MGYKLSVVVVVAGVVVVAAAVTLPHVHGFCGPPTLPEGLPSLPPLSGLTTSVWGVLDPPKNQPVHQPNGRWL